MHTDDLRIHNLAFLLSVASLDAACIINTTNGDDDGGSSATAPTSGDLTSGGTAGGTTDAGTGGGTGAATGAATTEPGTTTDPTAGSTGATGGGDSTGGAVHPCASYAALFVDCYGDDAGSYDACIETYDYLAGLGLDGCVEAYADYLVCVSEVSCRAFMAGKPCPDEAGQVDMLCGA